jgi:hypothetical protein
MGLLPVGGANYVRVCQFLTNNDCLIAIDAHECGNPCGSLCPSKTEPHNAAKKPCTMRSHADALASASETRN